ncbi:hypothetical protein R6Q59_009927 [Mikania micrantha]
MRLAFLLLTLLTHTFARGPPTSFCKCICFTNSTIIPLNSAPPTEMLAREEDTDGHDAAQHRRLTCSDCTRAFCLDYKLAICKGAKEEDVFTSCFQRDSLKDETIVLLFIVVTAALLGWAVIRPWVDKVRDVDAVQRYASIGEVGGTRGDAVAVLPAYRGRASSGSESFARQGGLNS